MGQYYKLACPEAGTMISSRDFGGGVKALEQIWSFGSPAALALLSATTTGTHPRDLPWAPKGQWAGRAPLMLGDYANQNAPDGDLIDRDEILPAPEDKLYELAGEKTGSLTTAHRRSKSAKAISEDMLPILERAGNIRFTDFTQEGQETGRWRDIIEVAPSTSHATGWDVDMEAIEPQYLEEVQQYWERTGILEKENWRRPPLTMTGHDGHAAPDHVPSVKAAGTGDALLWVNLDRCEFIDPEALGDTPDLAGVMDGKSAKAVLGMICHHDRRGGGDLADLGPLHIGGRWRGDRIVLMGKSGFKPKKGPRVEQGQVRHAFTDVSGNALVFIDENLLGDRSPEFTGEITTVHKGNAKIEAIMKACFSSPTMVRRVEADRESLTLMTLRIVPPLRITHDHTGKALKCPIEVAGTVDLRKHGIDGAKVWLPAETQKALAAAVAQLPREDLALGKGERSAIVSLDQIKSLSLTDLSNHGMIELMAA